LIGTGIAENGPAMKVLLNKNDESIGAAIRNADDEEAKTESVIDAIGDGIRILGRDFKILYENQIHKDLMGSHKGQCCYAAYRQREEICEGCGVAESFLDGKVRRMERKAPTRKGIAHLEITASPLRDATGKIVAGIEVIRDVTERKKADLEREKLIGELTRALEQIKTLRGLLHTCAWCRKIRDDKGSWNRAETYIERHSQARFTHGICPDCLKKHSPEAYQDLLDNPEAYEKLLETYRGVMDSDAGDNEPVP